MRFSCGWMRCLAHVFGAGVTDETRISLSVCPAASLTVIDFAISSSSSAPVKSIPPAAAPPLQSPPCPPVKLRSSSSLLPPSSPESSLKLLLASPTLQGHPSRPIKVKTHRRVRRVLRYLPSANPRTGHQVPATALCTIACWNARWCAVVTRQPQLRVSATHSAPQRYLRATNPDTSPSSTGAAGGSVADTCQRRSPAASDLYRPLRPSLASPPSSPLILASRPSRGVFVACLLVLAVSHLGLLFSRCLFPPLILFVYSGSHSLRTPYTHQHVRLSLV